MRLQVDSTTASAIGPQSSTDHRDRLPLRQRRADRVRSGRLLLPRGARPQRDLLRLFGEFAPAEATENEPVRIGQDDDGDACLAAQRFHLAARRPHQDFIALLRLAQLLLRQQIEAGPRSHVQAERKAALPRPQNRRRNPPVRFDAVEQEFSPRGDRRFGRQSAGGARRLAAFLPRLVFGQVRSPHPLSRRRPCWEPAFANRSCKIIARWRFAALTCINIAICFLAVFLRRSACIYLDQLG